MSEIPVREGRNLKTVPWGHQQAAIDFLQTVFRQPTPDPLGLRSVPDGGGAMLAMGMGTGKSLDGVSMICNLPIADYPRVLIAAPLRVVSVWPGQIAQHAGRRDIRVLALDDRAGGVKDKRDAADQLLRVAKTRGDVAVCIVNYESLWRPPFSAWAMSQTWGLVILDESHRIKQPSGKAAMFCSRLRTKAVFRLCLTGTPLPHSPLDIYSQFRFLDPSIFGSTYTGFKVEHAVFGGFNGKQVVAFRNLDRLEDKMRSITFRVGKEVLDLPPEMHVTYDCFLSKGAQKVYDDLEREFVAEVKQGTVSVKNAMHKILGLQQVTSGFVKTELGDVVPADEHNAKGDLLEDTLEDIGADEPVVVFCRFHQDLNLVHAIGRRLNRGTLELSGRASSRTDLQEWQDGAAPILAVQIQAGGVGIDLTRARYSIYYSLGYSLGDYDQSLSRIHRPGQTRPVTHIHLLARETVDGKVMSAIGKRADIVNSILDELREQVR